MKAHLNYLKYVLRHKWYVFLACRTMRVSTWRAIIHDWTKLTPLEWTPYVHNFFNKDGTRRSVRDASGAYDPNIQTVEFKKAWLSHQKNKHHYQAWISIGDNGNLEALPIPEKYLREMIADWIGAGMAISGRTDWRPWYEANKNKMILHPEAREFLDSYEVNIHEMLHT